MEKKKEKTPALQNEATNGLTNSRGTVAMARTQDPHSARVQFFVNLKDNDFLNHTTTADPRGWGYTVFGKVTQGMDVVDKIAALTGNAGNYETYQRRRLSKASKSFLKNKESPNDQTNHQPRRYRS